MEGCGGEGVRHPEVIVICGAPRSGTHLLNAVVANSKSVPPVLPETTPVTIILDAYIRTCRNNEKYPVAHFKSQRNIEKLYGGYLRSFLEAFKELRGSERVVLRAPILATMAVELTELLEEAGYSYHMLCGVRDPRDVIASFITAEQKRGANGMAKVPDLKDIGALCREFYQRYYSPVLRVAKKGRVTFINYERLVADTKREVKRIEEAVGLDLTSLQVEKPWSRVEADLSQEHRLHGDWITPLYMSGISAASVGKYKEVLSAENVGVVDVAVGDLYRRLCKEGNS